MSPIHPPVSGLKAPSARCRFLSNERGSALVLITASMTALISVAALAIDIGMLLSARSEAQRAADAAALAGAGYLIVAPNDEAGARAEAVAIGEQNKIVGDPAEILDEDVVIDTDAGRVEVTVWRRGDRGNAVATWFARVFGEDLVDVAARAVAEVAAGTGAVCVKPWAIPDGWFDADGDGAFDGLLDLGDGLPLAPLGGVLEYYDPEEYGYGTVTGSNFRNITFPNNGVDPPGTRYYRDRGRPIVLKPGRPEEAILPGWYFAWDMPQPDDGPVVGGDRYRWNIANCNPSLIELGQEYWVQNGNLAGPTTQGARDLIQQDPYADWDLAAGQVTASCCPLSPRVVYIPLFSPALPIEPGKNPIVFNNMTAFFIEDIQGDNIVGRLMEIAGVGGDGPTASQIRFARLVE